MAQATPELCAFLRNARIARGMTQKQVAEKIGTSTCQVSNWERMAVTPYPRNLKKWSDAVGVFVDVDVPDEKPKKASDATMKLCHRLRSARIVRNMTSQEVADELGVIRKTVLGWERGHLVPSVKKFIEWADVLDLKVALDLKEEL